MLRVLILCLLFVSVSFAQAQKEEAAYKFFDYEKISDKLLLEKTEAFCAEINKTGWIGYFVNYGTDKEIAKRQRQIIKSMRNYECGKEFPSPRTVVLSGEKKDISKTIFWVVPPGKKPPLD